MRPVGARGKQCVHVTQVPCVCLCGSCRSSVQESVPADAQTNDQIATRMSLVCNLVPASLLC